MIASSHLQETQSAMYAMMDEAAEIQTGLTRIIEESHKTIDKMAGSLGV